MPLSRRYTPEHPPGEVCSFGLDYSFVIPVGVAIASGDLDITPAGMTVGPIEVRGRAIYATVSGGVSGVDYQFKFTAVDSAGNVWPRTVLCLCADTS